MKNRNNYKVILDPFEEIEKDIANKTFHCPLCKNFIEYTGAGDVLCGKEEGSNKRLSQITLNKCILKGWFKQDDNSG